MTSKVRGYQTDQFNLHGRIFHDEVDLSLAQMSAKTVGWGRYGASLRRVWKKKQPWDTLPFVFRYGEYSIDWVFTWIVWLLASQCEPLISARGNQGPARSRGSH